MTLPRWLTEKRSQPAWVLVVAFVTVGLAVVAVTYWAGGTRSGAAQLMLVPVVLTAATLGSRHGLLAGIVGGVGAALIPFDTATGITQEPGRWVIRLAMLASVGFFVGYVRSGLIDLSRARSRFISTVSHELRTPLTSVVGFSEALYERRGEVTDPSLVEMIGYLRKESFAMNHTLDQMLVAARLDTGVLAVDLHAVDLRATLVEVIEHLPPIGSALSVSVRGNATALCDRLRATQILRNLLVHAAQSNGGTALIEISREESRVAVMVQHSGGPLVDNPNLNVFAPFYEAKPQPDLPVARWLSLSVSQQLARLMNGDLTYDHGGDRSVFRLLLPAA